MMTEKFPEPEGSLPADPGPAPTSDLNCEEYRAWRLLAVTRKKWMIAKRQSAIARSIDDLLKKGEDGVPPTPVETICLVIGAAYLDGSLHSGTGTVLDMLFG